MLGHAACAVAVTGRACARLRPGGHFPCSASVAPALCWTRGRPAQVLLVAMRKPVRACMHPAPNNQPCSSPYPGSCARRPAGSGLLDENTAVVGIPAFLPIDPSATAGLYFVTAREAAPVGSGARSGSGAQQSAGSLGSAGSGQEPGALPFEGLKGRAAGQGRLRCGVSRRVPGQARGREGAPGARLEQAARLSVRLCASLRTAGRGGRPGLAAVLSVRACSHAGSHRQCVLRMHAYVKLSCSDNCVITRGALMQVVNCEGACGAHMARPIGAVSLGERCRTALP